MATPRSHRLAGVALLAVALLYIAWFHDDRHAAAALLVFALPPLLLALPAWRGGRRAAFWGGVLALFWFSHGVMVAYTRPAEGFFLGRDPAVAAGGRCGQLAGTACPLRPALRLTPRPATRRRR